MNFIIGNNKVPLKRFSALVQYEDQISYLSELIDFLKEWFDEEKNTFKFKTSGSTGSPKTILHSRKAIKKSASKTNDFFDLNSKKTLALALPIKFVAGKMMLIRALESNANLLLLEPSLKLELPANQNIDFIALTPIQFYHTFTQNSQLNYIPRTILLGGSDVNNTQLDLIQKLDADIYLSYGMTETLTHVALKNLKSPKPQLFKALPGIIFKLGLENNLIIHADHLPKNIITNDIVELHNNTTFKWLGRKDFIINSGGLKVIPEEIESNLKDFISHNFIICGLPDDQYGEIVTMVIENATKTEMEKVQQILEDKIESKYRPRRIYTIDAFPLTTSGKIARRELINTINQNN